MMHMEVVRIVDMFSGLAAETCAHGERIAVSVRDGALDVSFFGDPYGESFAATLELVAHPSVAAELTGLWLAGPDEGANGVRNWDVKTLANTSVEFPRITALYLEPTQPEHHNVSVVGPGFEESGLIARVVAKMPNLRSLTVPSAPDPSFFAKCPSALTKLRIESGFDHQDFWVHARREGLPQTLAELDYADSDSTPVRQHHRVK